MWLIILFQLIWENEQEEAPPHRAAVMLLNALLVVLSSQGVWSRKSEPSLHEAAAGLFKGSDKYDFAIQVPAAEMECFWHFAHQSGNFYLTYMVRISTLYSLPGTWTLSISILYKCVLLLHYISE